MHNAVRLGSSCCHWGVFACRADYAEEDRQLGRGGRRDDDDNNNDEVRTPRQLQLYRRSNSTRQFHRTHFAKMADNCCVPQNDNFICGVVEGAFFILFFVYFTNSGCLSLLLLCNITFMRARPGLPVSCYNIVLLGIT